VSSSLSFQGRHWPLKQCRCCPLSHTISAWSEFISANGGPPSSFQYAKCTDERSAATNLANEFISLANFVKPCLLYFAAWTLTGLHPWCLLLEPSSTANTMSNIRALSLAYWKSSLRWGCRSLAAVRMTTSNCRRLSLGRDHSLQYIWGL